MQLTDGAGQWGERQVALQVRIEIRLATNHNETGITHINSPTVGGEAQFPFGGMKATGVGLREMGRVAIDFYTELKVVYVDYTGGARKGNLY